MSVENNFIHDLVLNNKTTEHNIKKEIYYAIKMSENILDNLKGENGEREIYKEAKEAYNILRNEILEAYNNDQQITSIELKGLKDEITAVKQFDTRNDLNQIKDKVSDFFNIESSYNSINDIEKNIAIINEKPAEYFYKNKESINLIGNSEKLEEVLNYFIGEGDKLLFKYINKDLFNEFSIKEGVDLDIDSLQYLRKETIENNLGTLIQNNDKYLHEMIILEACNKGIDPDIIKQNINDLKLNITQFDYINIYIGNKELISEDSFNDIYKTKSIEKISNFSQEKQNNIINFLSANINNPEYEGIIINLINNDKYTGNIRLLNITSTPILKSLLEQDIKNIHYIGNEKIKDIEIINTYLEELQKKSEYDADDIFWDMNHINKNQTDINNTLHIFDYIKNNIPNKYIEVLNIIKEEEYLGPILNLFKKSDNNVQEKYLSIYSDIEKIINNDISNILILNTAVNDFNITNQDMTIDEYKRFSSNLSEKLNGLDNKVKTDILKEIGNIDGEFDENTIKNIYNILKAAYNNNTKNSEFKNYFEEISKEISNFKSKQNENICELIPDSESINEKFKNDKGKLDQNKILEFYNKLIEGKSKDEIILIKENFLNDNFSDVQIESIIKILNNLDYIDRTSNILENYEEYVEYMEIKEKNQNLQIDFKEYIVKLNEPSNNFFISSSENYLPTNGGYNLKGKNGEIIEGFIITEEEMKNTLGNPEATENLINFHNFFKELNLEGVWDYRKELITAIGDITIDPNDGDSIKTEELRKFGNNILTFIENVDNNNEGNNEKIDLPNIDSVNSKLREFSGKSSILSDSKTFNIEGEDRFTAYLRKQGIIGGAYFKISKFREFI